MIIVDVTIKGKEKNAQAIRVKMLDSPRFVAKKSAMKTAISWKQVKGWHMGRSGRLEYPWGRL